MVRTTLKLTHVQHRHRLCFPHPVDQKPQVLLYCCFKFLPLKTELGYHYPRLNGSSTNYGDENIKPLFSQL